MKIGVVGSRGFPHIELVGIRLFQCGFSFPDETIVTGGAKGVDEEAERFGQRYNLDVIVFEPDWDKHGKSAGPIRNQKIVDEVEQIFAFWDGESNGTKDVIKKAMDAGVPVDVIIRQGGEDV